MGRMKLKSSQLKRCLDTSYQNFSVYLTTTHHTYGKQTLRISHPVAFTIKGYKHLSLKIPNIEIDINALIGQNLTSK